MTKYKDLGNEYFFVKVKEQKVRIDIIFGQRSSTQRIERKKYAHLAVANGERVFYRSCPKTFISFTGTTPFVTGTTEAEPIIDTTGVEIFTLMQEKVPAE